MTDVAVATPRGTASIRRLLGTLHLWFGLSCGIPAAVLGVTGILLMLVHSLPATVTADRLPDSLDAMIAAARAVVPADAVPQQITAPVTSSEVTVIRFAVPRTPEAPRGSVQVEVDQSGSAHRVDQPAWRGIVHDLHANFLGDAAGRWVVGLAGAVMTLLALTGVTIWCPRPGQWLNAFIVTGRGGVLRFLREIHGAAGIWGLIVFAIVSVTGVVLAVPNQPAGGPPRDGGRQGAAPKGLDEYRIDAAVAVARAAQPGAVLRIVNLPRRPGEAYEVRLAAVGDDRFAPPTAVMVDADAANVTAIRPPTPTAETFASLSRRLHTGRGGWVWWTLVLISGALPVGFVCSGTAMWLLKRRNRARVG